MSLRLRLLLLLLAIYGAGGWYLTQKALEQVRPRYLESMEESLVDTSVLLAGAVEAEMGNDPLPVGGVRRAVAAAQSHQFDARIFSLHKTGLDLRLYVTDGVGRVIFDSTGKNEGRDFSQWNDVARTLRGQYGARSTRDVKGDDNTQFLYVAAPIRQAGKIVGVLSVGKPTRAVNELVTAARTKLMYSAIIGGVLLLAVLLLVASWVIAPIERLTEYARAVRDGRKVARPPLPGRTLRDLGRAFEEMRDALEGRKHVERYTQTLTHEVKAPLAAIRGAAELLDENMPVEQRQKFVANIRTEAVRIQRIVDRLLELSSLEARKQLRQVEGISAILLAGEACEVLRPACAAKKVGLTLDGQTDAFVRGELVLLREALVNLLQNALDFSPSGRGIALVVTSDKDRVIFSVEDRGPGVPDYALSKVFDRFYSLPRPGTGRKSTGLGLALVREIAHLHGGEVTLTNRPDGGAKATITIPIKAS
ncbi:MAG TPA: two-component system sensor histidine kinase CreC [Candidatus Didemnitutus sp.]|nr:two-component system sensor histidine kinase CreC [Candidatus Didemnitutus sp.]